MFLRTILMITVTALGFIAGNAWAQHVAPSALLTIDQNRTTVVDRIVNQWGDRLARSNAGISSAQLREILSGLRSDHLLAASLAGSVEGLRDVVSGALVHTDAAVSPGLIHTKSLGDTNDDLVYTPVVPCRILDTRNGTVPPYNAQMVGGVAFPVAANLSNFAPQGGSETNCGLPASFQAVVVTFTVLNPNFDAFLAASNTSNFATLTQSVVMDFIANKGLANTATVPVDGMVKFYLGLPALVTTHVIADIAGYFKPPGSPLPVTTVTAGTGLAGGGTSGTVSVGIANGGVGNTQLANGAVDVPKLNTTSTDARYFKQGGNAFGANAIIGTTDNNALEIAVNGARAMRYEPNVFSPNVIGGHPNNVVGIGNVGATIAGGGLVGNNCYDPPTMQYNRSCGNQATGVYSFIGGGNANIAFGPAATISGGEFNTASLHNATVAGGKLNIASNQFAVVGGGNNNSASGYLATVGGGLGNTASNNYASVAGGAGSVASGRSSVVAGGEFNNASGDWNTVGGGSGNAAGGSYTTVAGGASNNAGGSFNTIGGGTSNSTGDNNSTVPGGANNIASGYSSIAAGGRNNTASGQYSLAAGRRATTQTAGVSPTLHNGVFVWADSNDFDFNSTVNNEFSARATGGVRFVLGIDGTGASTWTCAASNGNSWACSSDRNLKENFQLVDSVKVLQRLSELPLYFWNAKGTDPNVRHMGPTAQDFMAAFALGNSDKMIGMQDADGVALAAIQGLHQMMQEKDREIAQLRRKLQAIEAKLGL